MKYASYFTLFMEVIKDLVNNVPPQFDLSGPQNQRFVKFCLCHPSRCVCGVTYLPGAGGDLCKFAQSSEGVASVHVVQRL